LRVYQNPDQLYPNPKNGQEERNYHSPQNRQQALAKPHPISYTLKHSSYVTLISDLKHLANKTVDQMVDQPQEKGPFSLLS
jgi:hypothetical protein